MSQIACGHTQVLLRRPCAGLWTVTTRQAAICLGAEGPRQKLDRAMLFPHEQWQVWQHTKAKPAAGNCSRDSSLAWGRAPPT